MSAMPEMPKVCYMAPAYTEVYVGAAVYVEGGGRRRGIAGMSVSARNRSVSKIVLWGAL